MPQHSGVPDRPLAVLENAAGGSAPALPILRPVVRIGQGPQNDIVIDDDTVSTSHAALEFGGGSWRVTDLSSRNGTYVEGQRIESGVPTVVPDGANVGFGATRLRFRVEPGVDPEAVMAAPAPQEASPAQRASAGFRLPVWLFILILLIVGVIVFLVVTMTGTTHVTDPMIDGTAAFSLFPFEVVA